MERLLPPGAVIQIDKFVLTAIAAIGQKQPLKTAPLVLQLHRLVAEPYAELQGY